MTSPVASSSASHYVEMNRRFDTQSDGGVDMEVAMAATVFRDLQDAGYIAEGARLADEPPSSGTGVEGTSYEARLVELVTDRDSDGRLDLDLDRLRSAGILQGRPSSQDIDRVLTEGPRTRLSDQFIGRQDRRSELSYLTLPDDRGRRVQDYSQGMILQGSQDRAQSTFVSEIAGRAGQGETEARQVGREAIAGAQLLTQQGDQRHAQELLADTGTALMDAGQRSAAAQVYRELGRSPYADTRVNLMQSKIDATQRADRDYTPGSDIALTSGGTTNTIDVSDFSSTYGELAQHRLQQIETHDRMEQRLGRSVDPTQMADAQAYFQSYAQGHSTDEVRQEYQTYLESFYVHTGHGVEWSSDVAENDRPAQLDRLLDHQPNDDSGRCMVDCEGYTYLTDSILGGITDEDGQERFAVTYAQRPGHVISGVFDRSSGEGFTVNNDNAEMMQGDLSTTGGQVAALALGISEGTYNLIQVGLTPSSTETQDDDGAPALGAIVWDGYRARGIVDEGFRQGYREWSQQTLGGNPSQYIAHLDRQGRE